MIKKHNLRRLGIIEKVETVSPVKPLDHVTSVKKVPPSAVSTTDHRNRWLQYAMFIILAMLLFPPFHVQVPNGNFYNLGYGFILSTPYRNNFPGTINVPILLVQWIGVLLVCGIGHF